MLRNWLENLTEDFDFLKAAFEDSKSSQDSSHGLYIPAT